MGFVQEATLRIRAVATGVDAVASSVEQRLTRMGSSMRSMGTQMTFAGAAITGALGAAVMSAVRFEEEWAKVEALVPASNISDLQTEVDALARTMGIDAVTAARGAFLAISANNELARDTAEGMAFMTAAMRGSVAGSAELDTTVDALTTVMAAWSAENLTAVHGMDILIQTAAQGKTDLTAVAGSIGRVATLAAEAGLSFEETGAALARLTGAGLSTEESVTALRASILGLLAPTGQAREAAEMLGLDFNMAAVRSEGLEVFMGRLGNRLQELANDPAARGEFIEVMRVNMRALEGQIETATARLDAFPRGSAGRMALSAEIDDLRGRWGALRESLGNVESGTIDAGEAMAELFPNIRAMLGATILASQGAEGLTEHLDLMREATANAGEAVDLRLAIATGTAAFRLNQMREQAKGLGRDIGYALLPAVLKLFERLTPLIEKMSEWIKMNPDLVAGVLKVVGAIGLFMVIVGPILIILGSLVTTIGGLITMFKALGIIKLVAGVFGFLQASAVALAAALGLPIIAVAAIIAAIVALGVAVWYFWDEIKAAFAAGWEFVQNIFGVAWDFITEFFANAKDVISGFFEDAWEAVSGFFSGLWEMISGFFSGLIEMVAGALSAAWETVTGFFTGIWEAATGFFGRVVEAIIGFFGSIIEGIGQGFANVWQAVEDFWQGIVDWCDGIIDWFFDLGVRIMGAIWDGIKSLAGAVRGWVEGFIDAVLPGDQFSGEEEGGGGGGGISNLGAASRAARAMAAGALSTGPPITAPATGPGVGVGLAAELGGGASRNLSQTLTINIDKPQIVSQGDVVPLVEQIMSQIARNLVA